MTLAEEIRMVSQLRDVAKELAKTAEDAKTNYERAQRDLWDRMDCEDISSIKVGDSLYVRKSMIYGTVNDKATFVEWAQENAPELIAPGPRRDVVNERVRQAIDNGEELPPGVNYYTRQYVSRQQS